MKRSRIICSIITVVYTLLLLLVVGILIRSNIRIKSDISSCFKAIHIALFGACVLMYMYVKNKLNKKIESAKLIYSYRYLYLAVIVLISRIGLAYILKGRNVETIIPSFGNGLGSYVTYVVYKIIGNAMYANIVVNTVITFAVVILIKRIMFNITKSDFLSAMSAVIYILLPQSMYYITEYNRYNYNLIFVLLAFLLLVKIIDEVRQYRLKNKKYIHMSGILAIFASLDILFGGSYILWVALLLITVPAANNIDFTHMCFGDKLKEKLGIKFNRLLYKWERINISKLLEVALAVIIITSITFGSMCLITKTNNFARIDTNVLNRIEQCFMHSRNYYIVIIAITIVLECVGIALKRRPNVKMTCVKLLNILSFFVMLFSVNLTYVATIFDVTLVMLLVSNICNIYYNREEKIKLLKEKN